MYQTFYPPIREYDKLLKACEESKEKFSEMESQDAKCHEDIKLNKAKLKKLEKSLELELTKVRLFCLNMPPFCMKDTNMSNS